MCHCVRSKVVLPFQGVHAVGLLFSLSKSDLIIWIDMAYKAIIILSSSISMPEDAMSMGVWLIINL